ncbi:MAG TPA: response regulator transcription factor [Rhodocyclaceae bacterium]|nr:response regulator transcription factor [Rhodocyclaceae bacterium]HNF63288.1 response regulator transcription factor [Rhodocyclaceae bacterium]HNO87865.1 response regulator transcription factor [Rhodocyclaceae bacterium]
MKTNQWAVSRRPDLLDRWRSAFPGGGTLSPEAVTGRAFDRPAVLWVDVCQDGGVSEALIASLHSLHPDIPIVALDAEPDAAGALRVLQAGAAGYCHRLAAPEIFHQVATVVRHGGLWLRPELMGRVLGATFAVTSRPASVPAGLQRLSPREREAVLAVARGGTNKEVARQLGITERTVKAHLSAAFEKLGVRDRLQLVLALGRDAQLLPAA